MRRVLIALVLLAVAAPAAQAARRGSCTESGGGPRCTFKEVRATFIADGDTIRVLEGGRTRTIRFTGINAMELTRYSKYPSRRRGACHGLEATSLVERAVRGSHWRVRLAAQRQSSHSRHRERRSVWVKRGGRWRDLARMVVSRGLALWLPNGIERAHNREYAKLAQRAAAKGIGLYDPDSCGAGPDQDIPITVTVNWDADGNDAGNLDGEWAEIHNGGTRALDLSSWWLRDSWLRPGRAHAPGYRFAAGTILPAGGTLRLHAGCASDSREDLHWCQRDAVFENAVGGMGDGGYLFDPGGDLRAWSIYPCLVACSDPLAGKVAVGAHPRSPEEIAITNTSAGAVDLGGHVLKLHLHGRPDAFVFGVPFEPGTILQPGETLRVAPKAPLADGMGAVSLRTATDILTACDTWGGGRCR